MHGHIELIGINDDHGGMSDPVLIDRSGASHDRGRFHHQSRTIHQIICAQMCMVALRQFSHSMPTGVDGGGATGVSMSAHFLGPGKGQLHVDQRACQFVNVSGVGLFTEARHQCPLLTGRDHPRSAPGLLKDRPGPGPGRGDFDPVSLGDECELRGIGSTLIGYHHQYVLVQAGGHGRQDCGRQCGGAISAENQPDGCWRLRHTGEGTAPIGQSFQDCWVEDTQPSVRRGQLRVDGAILGSAIVGHPESGITVDT